MAIKIRALSICAIGLAFSSCGVQQTAKNTKTLSNIEKFANDSLFKTAYVGFALVNEKTGKTVEEFNADKYMVPASNTKLFTTYAALKYLKDSLPGFYIRETKDTLYIKPNGDPTFLNRSFKEQKLLSKLATSKKTLVIEKVSPRLTAKFGSGWSWANFQEAGVAERSVMPIYNNVVRFTVVGDKLIAYPKYFQDSVTVSGSLTDAKVSVVRNPTSNVFTAAAANANALTKAYTLSSNANLPYLLLQDTLKALGKKLQIIEAEKRAKTFWKPYYTHKTVDVLRPMMHNSDNYLAEQLLIMVGSEINGTPNDFLAINHIKKNNLSQMSTSFNWADGSGLSRSNQVTARGLTDLLVQLKREFGWSKISDVLQGGNQGTVKGLYKGYEKNIYTKTGTLGNHVLSLSGYLITKKGNNYVFSFIINNHYKDPNSVKLAFETYLINIIETQ